MNSKEFREFGKAAVDYIANYYETIHERQVLPSVEPGFLRPMLPVDIPSEPDSWHMVLEDVERVIMPGMTHWRSPHFHAYFPSGGSFPSIVGEIMSAALGVIGFSWASSPISTELELLMMDWLTRAMGLPSHFLNLPGASGGGVLQATASESTLYALLVAKERAVRKVQLINPDMSSQEIKSKLICYSSESCNSSVEKAALLASVPIRLLPADKEGCLRGAVVKTAIEDDLKIGLIPCYVAATFGTTGSCSFDSVVEIGPVCERFDVWLHVDAAYAGAALVCPELRPLMKGIEYADSLVINLHKWLLVNFDCAALWFKSSMEFEKSFQINRIYLKNTNSKEAKDLRNFQIALGKKFRALKVWFTLRLHGLSGLQSYIRKQIREAEEFEGLVLQNPLYEVVVPRHMGLVCFRLKEGNHLTSILVEELTRRKQIHVIPATLNGTVFIRFVVCNTWATKEDLEWAWQEIQTSADIVREASQKHSQPTGSTCQPVENKITARVQFVVLENNKRIKMHNNSSVVPTSK